MPKKSSTNTASSKPAVPTAKKRTNSKKTTREKNADAPNTFSRFMDELKISPKELGSVVLVDPSVSLIHESDPFKKIELAGRTCYKSEGSITKTSSKKFVESLMKRSHFAMLEHASFVFELECKKGFDDALWAYADYIRSEAYLHVTYTPLSDGTSRILVSGNTRAILQRNIDDPMYQSMIEAYPEFREYQDLSSNVRVSCPEYHGVIAKIVDIRKIKDLTTNEFLNHFYITAKFITDRGVSHELVRHRPFSFAQESTRYCNYSQYRFGNHCTFCKPSTMDSWSEDKKKVFLETLSVVDAAYQYLTSGDDSLVPQQARAVLVNSLKTEIVVSGPACEWKHFFDLRSHGTTGAPHPDMKFVADIARRKINKYINSLKYENRFRF